MGNRTHRYPLNEKGKRRKVVIPKKTANPGGMKRYMYEIVYVLKFISHFKYFKLLIPSLYEYKKLFTHRPDFVLPNDIVLEVKNCVCADYDPDGDSHLKAMRKMQDRKSKSNPGCVVLADKLKPFPAGSEFEYRRSGIFPWGRIGQEFEGKKVVSARAIHHLRELANLVTEHEKSKSKQYFPAILFVINRGDCLSFRPCNEACPVFVEELQKAERAGVQVCALGVKWQVEDKEGGQAIAKSLGEMPVNLL